MLRGVFTMTRRRARLVLRRRRRRLLAGALGAFAGMIPEAERGDLIGAYHKRLFGDDQAEQTRFARAWAGWESALAVLDPGEARGYPSSAYSLAFARLENHYFIHDGFLDGDGHVLRHMPRIAPCPRPHRAGPLRHDLPAAYRARAAQGVAGVDLRMVTAAGHALSEPGISAELVAIMDGLRG